MYLDRTANRSKCFFSFWMMICLKMDCKGEYKGVLFVHGEHELGSEMHPFDNQAFLLLNMPGDDFFQMLLHETGLLLKPLDDFFVFRQMRVLHMLACLVRGGKQNGVIGFFHVIAQDMPDGVCAEDFRDSQTGDQQRGNGTFINYKFRLEIKIYFFFDFYNDCL